MKRVAIGAAAAVTAVGAAVAGQRLVKGGVGQRLAKTAIERSRTAQDRWHCITIYRSPEDLRTVPEPLAALGSEVEIRMRPAPAGRGTEVAARLRDEVPAGVGAFAAKLTGDDPVWRVRGALRESKQLAEIGEIVQPDQPGTVEPSLVGGPLSYALRHAREAGRL